MKKLTEALEVVGALDRGNPQKYAAELRWGQRWCAKHKPPVKKAGRDYRLTDSQVAAMKREYWGML